MNLQYPLKGPIIACVVCQVKKVKPHVLLGLSGVGGIFDEQVSSTWKIS